MSTENEKKIVEFLYSEHESEELVTELVRLMRPRLGILKGNPLGVSKRAITPTAMENTGAAVDSTAAAVALLLSPGLEYALGGEKKAGEFMDRLENAGASVFPVVLEPLADNGHWAYAGRAVFRGPAAVPCDSFAGAAEDRHTAGLFANGLAQAIGHRMGGRVGYR